MKLMKLLAAGAFVFALMTGPILAAEQTAAQTCCQKAAAAGKECTHKCCVAAHKDGKSCTKCNPNGEDLKLIKKKVPTDQPAGATK
jgi:hypothetical protein